MLGTKTNEIDEEDFLQALKNSEELNLDFFHISENRPTEVDEETNTEKGLLDDWLLNGIESLNSEIQLQNPLDFPLLDVSVTHSPNPKPKKKVKGREFDSTPFGVQEQGFISGSPLCGEVESPTNASAFSESNQFKYYFEGNSPPISQANGNNTFFLTGGTIASSKNNITPRRRSVSSRPSTPNYPYQNATREINRSSNDRPDLDANFVKLHILEMGFPELNRNPKQFCSEVVNYVCHYARIFVGGFYLNNNLHNTTSSWILTCTCPSESEFKQYFHYDVGERFIMQAATEKRCFCVHSSSWEHNSGLLSFLFVPIPNEGSTNSNAIAVMVLGTILKGEVDLHAHLLFLDQVRKPVASVLKKLLHIQHHLFQIQKLDIFNNESENLPKQNIFERSLVAVLSSVRNDLGDDHAVLATSLQGLITYVSPGTEKILGYKPEELKQCNLQNLHDINEIQKESEELEKQYKKNFPADFRVLVQRTLLNRGQDDTREWRWIRKDGSFIPVQMTVRPMYDNISVFGYIVIAKEIENLTSIF